MSNNNNNNMSNNQQDQQQHVEQQQQQSSSPNFSHRSIKGMTNITNTCYLNSALQALFSCHQLYHLFQYDTRFLQRLDRNFRHAKTPMQACRTKLCSELVRLHGESCDDHNDDDDDSDDNSDNDRVITRRSMFVFARYLWRVFPANFSHYTQEDSQELIQILLDTLYEESKTEVFIETTTTTSGDAAVQPTNTRANNNHSSIQTNENVNNTNRNDDNESENNDDNDDNGTEMDQEEYFILKWIKKQQEDDILKEWTKKQASNQSTTTKRSKKLVKNHHDSDSDTNDSDTDTTSDTNSDTDDSESEEEEKTMPKPYKQYVSPISDLFGGYLLNEVTCETCGNVSMTAQATLGGIAIEIPQREELEEAQQLKQINVTDASSDDENGEKNENGDLSNLKNENSGDHHEQKKMTRKRQQAMDLEQQISFVSSLLRYDICECLNPLNLPQWIMNMYRNSLSFSGNNNSNKSVHLFDCLDSFFRARFLDGCDSYHCEHCNAKSAATQKLSLLKLPKILCFHIKRFYTARSSSFLFNMLSSGSNCYKRTENVSFPNEFEVRELWERYMKQGFMPESVSTSSQMHHSKYKIRAVINHHGYVLSSGHYTSFVRHNDEWYLCDDSYVRRVSDKTVHNSEAYVLFYELVHE